MLTGNSPASILSKSKEMGGNISLKTIWENEFAYLEDKLDIKRDTEANLKHEVKRTRFTLKQQKRELAKATRERKVLQKKVASFWKGKSSWKYNRRKWGAQHPGEALYIIEQDEPIVTGRGLYSSA